MVTGMLRTKREIFFNFAFLQEITWSSRDSLSTESRRSDFCDIKLISLASNIVKAIRKES